MNEQFTATEFWARKVHARSAVLDGTVFAVNAKIKNGACVKAACSPKGRPNGMVVATWANPAKLSKQCVKVTEAEARRIQPQLFAALKEWDKSAAYREKVYTAVRASFPYVYPLQPVTIESNPGGAGGFAVDLGEKPDT